MKISRKSVFVLIGFLVFGCVLSCGIYNATVTNDNNPSLDPAVLGNAPEGAGLNKDPGPGTYEATPNYPPDGPYVAPTPPVGSIPDSSPIPLTESNAPTAEAPAQGHNNPPGM